MRSCFGTSAEPYLIHSASPCPLEGAHPPLQEPLEASSLRDWCQEAENIVSSDRLTELLRHVQHSVMQYCSFLQVQKHKSFS